MRQDSSSAFILMASAQLDKLPMFASDEEIGDAIVGKKRSAHWRKYTLPLLEARGFPRWDVLHEGRPVPLVRRYYASYLGVSANFVSTGADGEERLGEWKVRRGRGAQVDYNSTSHENVQRTRPEGIGPRRTKQQKYDEAKARSEAWAEKKRKALEDFRAKKAADTED